jgi:hypothetical protein
MALCGKQALSTYRRFALVLGVAMVAVLVSACTPTVQVEAPKEPITINLNIKLDADVRLKVEEKAKEDVSTKPIF